MAKRNTIKYEPPLKKAKRIINDERFKVISGIMLLVLAFVATLSFISYLLTWKTDQSNLELGFFNYFSDPDIQVDNWGGKFGAWLAQLFIHNLFGVPSFAFIVVAVMGGFNLVAKANFDILSVFKTLTVCVVWFSIALAYFFGDEWFCLGGVFGYMVDNWLESVFGKVGTFLLLLFSAVAYIMYKIPNSMEWVKMFFKSFGQNHSLVASYRSANKFYKSSGDIEYSTQDNRKKNNDSFFYTEGIRDNDTQTVDTEKKQRKSPFDFISQKIFKSRDYKGEQQTINFDTQEQKSQKRSGQTIEDIHYTINSNGEQVDLNSTPSDLDFDVEDTTKHQEETVDFTDDEPEMNVSSSNNLPVVANQEQKSGLDLEVETKHDLTAEDISNLPPYDPTQELSHYKLPPIDLLEDYGGESIAVTNEELMANKENIVEALRNFKINIKRIKATVGPTVTLYEITPAPGVKISKIKSLEDDIMLSLKAIGIRMIAPMPGRGTVGIEVPNKERQTVSMRSLISSVKFQETNYDLPIALGKNISNESYVMDLAKCPHLLVAGATGQGKSVGLNAIIASLLYKKHPATCKFVLVDPKKVELTLYARLEKHYLAKMPESEETIITDVDKVVLTLNSLTVEMDNRYGMLKEAECKNIKEYNAKFIARKLNPNNGHKYLPYIVVIIDEFADLIMTAGKEVEKPIARIAQLARAIGIHMIVATQRPTTNIITGLIKANFPTRIAFKVSSMMDSRTILDTSGANHLVGRGDMLITEGTDLVRLQCAFIDTPEIEKITTYIGNQQGYPITFELPVPEVAEEEGANVDLTKLDSLFDEAAEIVVSTQQGSTSLLQRKLSIGYNRAGKLIDQLEAAGIVGSHNGSKSREVLYDDLYALEQYLNELHSRENG